MVGDAGQVILNTKGVRRPHWSRRTHDHLRGFQESLNRYLPKVGLAVSAFSGVVLWVWYIAITRSFLKLGRSRNVSIDRGAQSGQ
jgi:hypothetical protein